MTHSNDLNIMAEIRSTMAMVLERAAKLETQASDTLFDETKVQDGMRLGANFMREDSFDIRRELDKSKDEKNLLIKGALMVFLRNIHLPRGEDDGPTVEKAMHGILQLGESSELLALLGEAKKITEQYEQHKKQIRTQLEEQFTQQIAMMQQQQGGATAGLDPENQPKFIEEWQKITNQLQDQYGEALEKHKGFIEQMIGHLQVDS